MKQSINRNLLELFNCVLNTNQSGTPLVFTEYGVVVRKEASYASQEISQFLKGKKTSGNEMNKTFYKSWEDVISKTRFELAIDQIIHYWTTYGTNFQSQWNYIPNDGAEVPDCSATFFVVNALTNQEAIDKCLKMLESGIALKEETIDQILETLELLGHEFTCVDSIRNREAVVKIADRYNCYPTNPAEFFRYLFFKSTGSAMPIKNKDAIESIRTSPFDPSKMMNLYGLDKISQVFNRYKPLFLAWKAHCPKTINRIAKLSKTNHVPLKTAGINLLTQEVFAMEDMRRIVKGATPFALFRALNSLNARFAGQSSFVYQVRNGRGFAKVGGSALNKMELAANLHRLTVAIGERFDLSSLSYYIPENQEIGLPTSEKMFVGNIPAGTKVSGNKLAVGVYWENSWGARDLDLSGISLSGKTGWNASYHSGGRALTYSGDITNAPNGAVEYLYANGKIENTIVMNNVFAGNEDCEYSIIVGEGSDMSRKYMMDPNNRIADVRCKSQQKQTILGLFVPNSSGNSFIFMNLGAGNQRVSTGKEVHTFRQGLVEKWTGAYYLNDLLEFCGATRVDSPEDGVDLSIQNLTRDSLISIFK